MTSLSVVLSASLERGLRESSVTFACAVVGELSTAGVLNCSLEHALSLFDFEGLKLTTKRSVAAKLKRAKELSGKTKKAKLSRTSKPTMILPFCGVIVTDWCYGVRLNHGLHTQCTNARVAEGEYCKTCTKAAANSATDKPPYGDIRDRASSGVNYRDPKGRQTLPYANVAEKLKLDIKKAHVAATAFGWTIPAEQLVKRSVKRGRPGKSAAVSDTDSVNSSKSAKKLKKKLTVKKTQSDLIAKLVAEAGEQLLGEDSDSGCHFCKSDHESSDCPSLAEDAAAKKASKLAEKELLKEKKLVQKLKKQLAALFGLDQLDADLVAKAAGKDSAALKKLIAAEKTGLKEAAMAAKVARRRLRRPPRLPRRRLRRPPRLPRRRLRRPPRLPRRRLRRPPRLPRRRLRSRRSLTPRPPRLPRRRLRSRRSLTPRRLRLPRRRPRSRRSLTPRRLRLPRRRQRRRRRWRSSLSS